jgi:hypothetical protein
MAGIITKAPPKVIGARTHSAMDYIHAGTNFLVGAMFRRTNRRASNAAFALGAGVLANALLTDYPLGVFRVYSFKVHGILDCAVAAASAATPRMLGISDSPEAKYFRIQGAAVTGVVFMTDYATPARAITAVQEKNRGGLPAAPPTDPIVQMRVSLRVRRLPGLQLLRTIRARNNPPSKRQRQPANSSALC